MSGAIRFCFHLYSYPGECRFQQLRVEWLRENRLSAYCIRMYGHDFIYCHPGIDLSFDIEIDEDILKEGYDCWSDLFNCIPLFLLNF